MTVIGMVPLTETLGALLYIITVTHTQGVSCHARHDRLPSPVAGATARSRRSACPAPRPSTAWAALLRHADPPRQAGQSGTAHVRPSKIPRPSGTSRSVDGPARTELLQSSCAEIRSSSSFIDPHPALHFSDWHDCARSPNGVGFWRSSAMRPQGFQAPQTHWLQCRAMCTLDSRRRRLAWPREPWLQLGGRPHDWHPRRCSGPPGTSARILATRA